MAFLTKLKRISLHRSNTKFILYILISCILLYLIITTIFVQRQHKTEIPSGSSVTKHEQSAKKRRTNLNIYNSDDDEQINDKSLKVFLQRKENVLDSVTTSPMSGTNLPCNPSSVSEYTERKDNISCIPHLSSNSACEFASKLYWRDDTLKSCGNDVKKVEICKYEEVRNEEKSKFVYECSLKDCKKYNLNNVKLWWFDPNAQNIEEYNTYKSAKTLEEDLPSISKKSSQQGYHFLFLECSKDDALTESYDATTQLFIIPPYFQPKKTVKTLNNKKTKKININLVLLDSSARSHFYRSLPITIETMKNINENKHTEAEIIDYRLFQSLEGHTAENLHALFTGELFPKYFTGVDRENTPVGVSKMFEKYHRSGYHTFYHDDLCFDEYWGIRLDLGSPTTWDEFQEKLKENYINHTGLTFSSCRILKANNVTNPFNGPDGPLCFNGRFQDSYLLDFTHIYHEYASKHNINLISFTALNVAHDHTGRRIQSIDLELADYVKKMAKSSNTLTVLFADHGNTYTHYTHAIMEGRFEQFHPALFFIVPEEVKKKLGDKIMNNLSRNQNKLCTLLDIHEALMTVPTEPMTNGVFGSIKPTRNCNDLNLRLPNLCVCEGWDAGTLNDTSQVGVLDFAVGTLNNKILSFQKELRKNKIPKCMRLVPLSFSNVRERNNEGSLITSLDFTTVSGEGASQSHDVFHVQIQSSINPEDESRDMKLLSFDRLSRYGPYSKCVDKGMDPKLCICNIKSKKEFDSLHDLVQDDTMKRPKLMTTDLSLIHTNKISKCLYFKTISYPETSEDNPQEESIFSCNYEVANMCDHKLNISLMVSLDNMKSTHSRPIIQELLPYSLTYIASMIRKVPYWSSKVDSENFFIIPYTSSPPSNDP